MIFMDIQGEKMSSCLDAKLNLVMEWNRLEINQSELSYCCCFCCFLLGFSECSNGDGQISIIFQLQKL